MARKREVTILIPTYFGNQMLYGCIESVMKNIPDIAIITYKNDIGWLKSANKLMEMVKTDVILLNDDTIVLSDLVTEMQNLIEKYDDVGIIGGKALSLNKQTIINYGIYVASDGNTAHKHYGQPKDSVGPEFQKAVEGSCIYIRREVIDQVGVFDENYGMGYREEVDLCFRAIEAGYKIISCPKAEYIHLVNQTHGRLDIHNDKYDYFMQKWGKKLALGLI